MKTIVASILISVIVCSCKDKSISVDNEHISRDQFLSDGQELPDPWYLMKYSPQKYVEMQPGRPIIISIGAKWTMTSQVQWRTLFTENVCRELKTRGILSLVSDVVHDEKIANSALSQFDRVAVPVTMLYNPKSNKWMVFPEVFDEDYFMEFVTRLDKNVVEQGASSDR
ncbi:hypothetical protein NT6N_24230 [Oceaniferula spumae]|uniref:Thioredoxin domain-containing protein n=1 Tax=Oceaniferula spumae TaxID=2979115 RepID=A0AAT9FN49_9BACT